MIEVTGLDRLEQMAQRLATLFSEEALIGQAMIIAAEAGVLLKEATVRKCVDEIYALSTGERASTTPINLDGSYGGLSEARTYALQEAHEVLDEGLVQRVMIDPDAQALPTAREGREKVIDYAVPVHEGYTQWVMGHNTGVYHIGRPWFWHTLLDDGEEIMGFVTIAFARLVEKMVSEL